MPAKILGVIENRFTFEASGGDVVLTLTSLAAGAGRISATYDRTAGSQPIRYGGSAHVQFATTPVAGEHLRLYLVEQWEHRASGSPAYKVGGALGTSDAAVSDEDSLLAGGTMIGRLMVPPSPAADTEYVSLPFKFTSEARKFQLGVWNATADGLTATATEHEIAVFPLVDESQ